MKDDYDYDNNKSIRILKSLLKDVDINL